jgi:hypothetical protein
VIARESSFACGVPVPILTVQKKATAMSKKDYTLVEDGYVYCTKIKHWRSGEYIYPKTSKYFRFKIGK